ncbi:MAG: hypothetical protein M1825_004811 [Sarcosagium campestre]|nr:MAG: hypothetical protein M1825_004811 [Sarcosagium campestre]
MAEVQPPLNYQSSAPPAHHQVSRDLPSEVIACLKNARFLHLATCDALQPHVSLMNYTYLASSPYTRSPTIIMTTNPSSKKTLNLINNPRVSLLVHDWVSHRPPTTSTNSPDRNRDPSSPPSSQAARSGLANLLLNLNTSALSSISATINGEASMVPRGTEEERYFKERHLENNTFGGVDGGGGGSSSNNNDGSDGLLSVSPQAAHYHQGDGGRGCFIEGEEVLVVAVRVRNGRIADWKGGVRDWSIEDVGDGQDEQLANGAP